MGPCHSSDEKSKTEIVTKQKDNPDATKERKENPGTKPLETSKGTTFTSLVKRDEDLGLTVTEIDAFLVSNEFSNEEKLRKVLLVLKSKTESEEETLKDKKKIEEFKTAFTGLIGRHYQKLYDTYDQMGKGYKPLIKVLQIFELMLENFQSNELLSHKKDLAQKMNTESQKIFKNSDWRFLRKLYEQSENLKTEKAPLEKELIEGYFRFLQRAKKALVWKSGKMSFNYAESIVDALNNMKNKDLKRFLKCLMIGRFHKKDLVQFTKSELNLNLSVLVGDEGGLYALLNTVPPGSTEEAVVLEAGVSRDFLESRRKEESHKVILGEGAFGKVRLALTILGDSKNDLGQLVCVKKSLCIGAKRTKTHNTLSAVMDSTFEDFFARKLNESVYAPNTLDMAIISNKNCEEQHRKAYLMMEVVPENTADKIFRDPKFQKWDFQKPYILEVLKTMKNLLLNNGVFNSDLKPPNTLLDPLSRKMAIIDLGSSIYVDKKQDYRNFDASAGGFGVSEPYCPPEIKDENQLEHLNLLKCLSYLCGVTIAEVTSEAPQTKKEKMQMDRWLIGKCTDLEEPQREILINTIKQLLDPEPQKRLEIDEAINRIRSIGSDDYIKKAIQEHYVLKARETKLKDPSSLNLNADINLIKQRGIIEQNALERNPKKIKNQKPGKLKEQFDEFFKSPDQDVFILLGEAGSGKSLSLQLRFLEELDDWEYKKNALPVFFNLADEVDLEKAFRQINSTLGCNIGLESATEAIHLFIDSYDEGAAKISEKKKAYDEKSKSSKSFSLIQEYLDQLSNWKEKKFIISCRTDFIQKEGEDDLSEFIVSSSDGSIRTTARFVSPINYGEKETNDNLKQEKLIGDWLNREKKQGDPKVILQSIKRLGLLERMGTGLMFNMIMSMMVAESEIKEKEVLRGFEIFKRTIREEFYVNWAIIVAVANSNQNEKEKEGERIKLLNEEFQGLVESPGKNF